MTNTQPAKICVVVSSVPPHYGGGALRVYRYAKRLASSGALGLILTHEPDRHARDAVQLDERETVASSQMAVVPAHVLGEHWGKDRYRDVMIYGFDQVRILFASALALIARRSDFDIVHSMGAASLNLYAIAVAKLLGKKTVLEMTLLGVDDPIAISSEGSLKARGKLRRWLFSTADRVVSKSPAMSEAYRGSGLLTAKLREVPNAVDARTFCPALGGQKAALRHKLGVGEDALVIVFVGIISERKGIEVLIRALARITSEHPKTLMLFVGPTDKNAANRAYSERMKALTNELGFSKNVRFVGTVGNVDEYLKASDVFVFPSRREGFPNALLEAMASGLAIVTSEGGSLDGKLVENGIQGLVVPTDDEPALSAAIERIIQDEALRELLARAARLKVEQEFSAEVVDRKYRELYAELVQNPCFS